MTRADPDLASHVHTAMARHGIHPGLSNHELSRNAHAHRPARV